MGQKVHPLSFRLPVLKNWKSYWFSKSQYIERLRQDVEMRAYLVKELRQALIDRIEIERTRQKVQIHIFSAKPGVVIGRQGSGITDLTKKLQERFFRGSNVGVSINVKEIKRPTLCARVVATQIAMDIERRMPYRRIMKQTIERVQKANAEGVKIRISGRLNGAEISRSESLAQGKIPLHTLRSDIDYAQVVAKTIYGAIGIKVWINRGEKFEK